MRNLILFLSITCCLYLSAHAQHPAGTLVKQKILATSIQGNAAGEDANRSIHVYLPPGYHESKGSYPVVYFLHGYSSDEIDVEQWIDFKSLMDSGIANGKLRPMIIVIPNSNTLFLGSFYTNSSYTGNWADFIAKEVVAWTDKNFRTIKDRRSRGICGHSMGGNGSLKLAMLYPDTFGAVYALSPAVLDWSDDFSVRNDAFKTISEKSDPGKDYSSIKQVYPKLTYDVFYVGVMSSLARTYSPNPGKLPFHADFPARYQGDSLIVDSAIARKWEMNFPLNMLESRLAVMKTFTAIKLDWGRNEQFDHIPATAMRFSKKLEQAGIKHFAEEYLGDHGDMIGGWDGRVNTELLPFFDQYLMFDKVEKSKGKN